MNPIDDKRIADAEARIAALETDLAEVREFVSVARKVSLWSRAKIVWAYTAELWFSSKILQPLGYTAAALVAIYELYAEVPWLKVWDALGRMIWP